MRKHVRLMALLLAGSAAGSVLAGCSGKEPVVMDSSIVVDTQTVQLGRFSREETYIGQVESANTVTVFPEVSGKVTELYFEAGEAVSEGDILFRIDDTDAQLAYQMAQNTYNQSSLNADVSVGSNFESQLLSAKTQVDSAKQALKTARLNYDEYIESHDLDDLEDEVDDAHSARSDAQNAMNAAAARMDEAKANMDHAKAEMDDAYEAMTAGENESTVPENENSSEPENTEPSTASGAEEAPRTETETDAGGPDNSDAQQAYEQAKKAYEQAKELYRQAQADYADARSAYEQANATYITLDDNYDDLESGDDIQRRSLRLALNTAQENLKTAQAKYDLLAGTSRESTETGANLDRTAAALSLEQSERALEKYTVSSPVTGVIARIDISRDNVASTGNPAVTILSAAGSKNIIFYVSEDVRDELALEQAVSVIHGDSEYAGSITEIGVSADASKGLFRIKATIGEAEGIPDGVRVELVTTTHAVEAIPLIPTSALYFDEGQAYVYLAENNVAVRQNIVLDGYDAEQVAISEGLQEGQEVITTWASGLRDGAVLRTNDAIEQPDAEEPADLIAGETAGENPASEEVVPQ